MLFLKLSSRRFGNGLAYNNPGFLMGRRGLSFDPHSIIQTMTSSLEAVHASTGLPWWALIPLTTFTLRSLWTLPLAVLQRRRITKQSRLRPIVSAMSPIFKHNLAKQVNKAKAEAATVTTHTNTKSDTTYMPKHPLVNIKYEEMLVLTAKEVRKRQKKLFKDNGVPIWKNFILPTFQVPLWIAMSLTMRDLSGWSTWFSAVNKPLDQSLYSEGALWFQDLAVSDPYHVFPILIGITALGNIEWLFKTLQLSRNSQRQKMRITLADAMGNISRLAVVFLMAISYHAPVALCLYWLSSQVYSLIQNVILDLVMPVTFLKNRRLSGKDQKNPNAFNIVVERNDSL
ncbi:hypothetical protein DIURU_001715 [Diutina rugosa]|uniref:Membrane insertase YidC/Oxa/ALB C-terminal domain-containing protein n=1 Tax=Diutina rugosa TaxID=5481 RepID=A0A642UU65_DIURU|nr:uncharacterized protein DIURU_001715 [Diutina rugosa]KAA8905287.1 hypothetical protein DIURU_001715 [Diutina rugosa]